MKKIITGGIVGLYTLGAITGVAPYPVISADTSTGAYTTPVFDSINGELNEGQYAVLEDGKSIYIHTKDYFGSMRESDSLEGLTEVHLVGHQDYGTFLDANSDSYIQPVTPTEAQKIYKGEKVSKTKLQMKGVDMTKAAIANTASKTFAGKNLITSSTTDITISSGDTVVAYGGFNNTNALNSMSLSCTSGTVIKANAGTVLSGAGNSHLWAIANPSVGTNTCTLTATSSAFFLVEESNYSGTLTTTAVLDAQTTNTCSSATSCTTTLSTVTDNDWTVVFAGVSSGAPSAGAGTTIRVSDSNGIGLADSNAAITPAGSTSLVLTRPASSGFATNMIGLAPPATATVNPGVAGLVHTSIW